MRINKLFTFLFFACSFFAKAQVEMLKPLSGNSTVINYKPNKKHNAQKSLSTPMYLPFFDDFSYFGPVPNDTLWEMSQSVFVNRGYAIAPPTIGVATFDGLGRDGYPYNIAATGGSFLSDSLISVPIRLDSIHALPIVEGDTTIILSFYYQMQGRGDKPEQNDVLNLFFFTPTDSLDFNSTPVWTKSGSNVNLQPNDTNFHRVMIQIYRTADDSIFFRHGLRFAFSNWGTQCGAIDHWHIDQVHLYKRATAADTVFPDVSMVYEGKSLLKKYSQMPYWQFNGAADMKDTIHGCIRNNKNTKSASGVWNGGVTLSTAYEIFNNTGALAFTTPTVNIGTNVVLNYDSIGYCQDQPLVNPTLAGYKYNSGPFPDSTSFLQKFYIYHRSPSDFWAPNDTAYFLQNFQNYYAYDDGTAEAAYYVAAFGGQMAVAYKLNFRDTLRSIDVFFDPVYGANLIQNENIRFVVWNDNGGKPGTTVFIDSMAWGHPCYNKNGYDVFTRYQLSKPIGIDSGKTFYVGTSQTTNVQLGIGFDLNTNNQKTIFFYDGANGWQNSYFKGSLMLRPVFGDTSRAFGIKSLAQEKQNVIVYPNPATSEIYFSSKDKIEKVLITDILGNTVLEEKNPETKLTVAALSNGMYLIRLVNNRGESSTQKLIISR
jgi:hypothetical protein